MTRLFCNASGFSTTITWKNVWSKKKRRDRNWIFRNITRFDNKGYTCYANNICGSVHKSIYVNVKCKSCLYHIDICIFNCNFSSNIKIKNLSFLLVFIRSSKENVSGHLQSDWPHDLISAPWKVFLNFPDFPFLKRFVKCPSSWHSS